MTCGPDAAAVPEILRIRENLYLLSTVLKEIVQGGGYATDSLGRPGVHARSRSHSETATSANDADHAQ